MFGTGQYPHSLYKIPSRGPGPGLSGKQSLRNKIYFRTREIFLTITPKIVNMCPIWVAFRSLKGRQCWESVSSVFPYKLLNEKFILPLIIHMICIASLAAHDKKNLENPDNCMARHNIISIVLRLYPLFFLSDHGILLFLDKIFVKFYALSPRILPTEK